MAEWFRPFRFLCYSLNDDKFNDDDLLVQKVRKRSTQLEHVRQAFAEVGSIGRAL